MNLNLDVIAPFKRTAGPWTLQPLRVVLDLYADKKSACDPALLRLHFNLYLLNNLDSFHIYTDGLKDQNRTASAAICENRRFICRLTSDALKFNAEKLKPLFWLRTLLI